MTNALSKSIALALLVSSFGPPLRAQSVESTHEIATKNYTITIAGPAFQFEVRNPGGIVIPADAEYGLSFLGSPAASRQRINQEGSISQFRVTNDTGKTALVVIRAHENTIEIRVNLEDDEKGDIRLRVGTPGPAYGLGDHGSFGHSVNLAVNQRAYPMAHDGAGRRWVSSFVVFPRAGGAGVTFDRRGGIVHVGPDYYEMANTKTNRQTFYYFVGSMPEIYAAYRKVRRKNGYPGVSPKPTGFELGWESWDALRWNTNADSVQQSIGRFLDADYPIRWAATGSGFWCDQGSTVHFGQFNGQKYPDKDGDGDVELKTWLHGNNIKWLIGQRVNFIPHGGPHSSKPGESGATLFETSPDTQAGIDGDFFLVSDNGQPVTIKSKVFPTVPCFLADGNQPGTPTWFEQLYRSWGVDGVKEDTMMSVPDHTIFNATMRRLSAGGAFVMARCGAYSAPGTLMRINDTNGPASMSLRAPINYLQYAACAAPNVYSDTVGFGHINDVNSTIRHAWFTALTAGMAVGRGPWKWSAGDQAVLKKAVDFHYAIGPYLYSAAVESHRTGYPHTMTPLPIAFPDDENTYDLASTSQQQFQWMIGPSLLAAPLLKNANQQNHHRSIYLPPGRWIDYDTGQLYRGPTTLDNFAMPPKKTPVFVGGTGVIVRRTADDLPLRATVYPIAEHSWKYLFTHPDGKSQSTIVNNTEGWNTSALTVTNTTTNSAVQFQVDTVSGAVTFKLTPDHHYELTGGSVTTPIQGRYSNLPFDGHSHSKYANVNDSQITVGKPIHCYRDPWIMDHSVIYNPNDKKWHMFGIYDDQTRFLHLTADSLTHEGWKKQEDFRGGDPAIWAPHIIAHDKKYWMFYTGIGEPRRIRLAVSSDLYRWTHPWPKPLLAQEFGPDRINMKNKDPMVLWDRNQWIMYYSMVKDDKANWVVGYSTSKDLLNWDGPHICYDEESPAPSVESPFVVRRGKFYYLFLSARPWGVYDGGVDVFRSTSPFAWNTSDKVKRIHPWHAPEIVRDLDGKWYITNCGFHKDGFWIAPLQWHDGMDQHDGSLPIPSPSL